jgi:hypothetical protein
MDAVLYGVGGLFAIVVAIAWRWRTRQRRRWGKRRAELLVRVGMPCV